MGWRYSEDEVGAVGRGGRFTLHHELGATTVTWHLDTRTEAFDVATSVFRRGECRQVVIDTTTGERWTRARRVTWERTAPEAAATVG